MIFHFLFPHPRALCYLTMAATRMVAAAMTLVVVMAFVAPTYGMSNELDYGNWNYREGGKELWETRPIKASG